MALKSAHQEPRAASLARRHFLGIAAAGAARVSSIALPSALLATKSADAMGIFPRDDDDPHRHRHHHCFGRGTLISTPEGEVPVEDLAIGGLVVTGSGPLPVKWIGRTILKKNASGSWHPNVIPVRVARSAIDDQTPRRDLYLSQGHSLLIDGLLIPVKHLVNECSIAFDEGAKRSDAIEFFSVVLDTHQTVFAEGTAAETFRYDGGQIAWDNVAEYEDLYGRERKEMPALAPHCRYKGGRAEVAALLRLAASRFVDMRDPIQISYARIAARTMSLAV